MRYRSINVLCTVAALVLVCALAASAAIEVLDATYRPDRVLPEFYGFWKDWYNWGDQYLTYSTSGAVTVYLKNTGAGAVTVSDLQINGASLASGLRCKEDKLYKCGFMACSVYYPSTDATLVSAGEPIWWRAEPASIPAGGTGEIYVRMRTRVLTTLSCTAVTGAGSIPVSIPVTNNAEPRVAGYALSPDSTTLYLYLRHPVKGKVPTQILIDGVDKTASCTMSGDSDCDLVPVKCNMGSALARGTYHCFQAVYNDGSKATDGLRVYYDDFKYGRWGSPPTNGIDDQRDKLIDMGEHSMNFQTVGWGNLGDIIKTAEGHAIMDQYGIRKIHEDPSSDRLYSIFLCDEIDGGDSNVPTNVVPATIGALAHDCATFSDSYKNNYSQYPTNLNLAANFKPYNHYIYGHVADILSVDPYYQQRLADAYWTKPNLRALYSKATYIYAVGSSCKAGCEPHRLHMILNCTRNHDPDKAFRWATPEEKRIEVYYALAAGAQEIAYWWFTPAAIGTNASCGIGNADEPGSASLWREMGLLGAEGGIASPVIVNSCPTSIPVTCAGKIWVRAALSGTNTLILYCVNDDYSVNDAGTIVRPVDNAEVSVDLPSWLASPAAVFDVSYKGIRDVSYSLNSGKADLHLGTLGVTKMIVITTDAALKATLQSRYTNTYGPRVAGLIPTP